MANPDKSSDAREEQPENISYMPCTFEVSKEDKSREVRDEQSENILPIPVTFEVSNEERSREARDEQPENISLMFVTLDVSRAERSTDLSDEQLQNISPMSVTLDVSSPERSADVKLRQAANILAVVFALTPWRILTVVNELLLQGPPSEEYHLASSPDVEPDLGLIVRHPLESIIHWQVPHSVQSTIGAPESLAACMATLLSSGAPSSSAPSFSTASSRLASELLAARALSIGSASPPSPSSDTWAASVGSLESPLLPPALFQQASAGRGIWPEQQPETT